MYLRSRWPDSPKSSSLPKITHSAFHEPSPDSSHAVLESWPEPSLRCGPGALMREIWDDWCKDGPARKLPSFPNLAHQLPKTATDPHPELPIALTHPNPHGAAIGQQQVVCCDQPATFAVQAPSRGALICDPPRYEPPGVLKISSSQIQCASWTVIFCFFAQLVTYWLEYISSPWWLGSANFLPYIAKLVVSTGCATSRF